MYTSIMSIQVAFVIWNLRKDGVKFRYETVPVRDVASMGLGAPLPTVLNR